MLCIHLVAIIIKNYNIDTNKQQQQQVAYLTTNDNDNNKQKKMEISSPTNMMS